MFAMLEFVLPIYTVNNNFNFLFFFNLLFYKLIFLKIKYNFIKKTSNLIFFLLLTD